MHPFKLLLKRRSLQILQTSYFVDLKVEWWLSYRLSRSHGFRVSVIEIYQAMTILTARLYFSISSVLWVSDRWGLVRHLNFYLPYRKRNFIGVKKNFWFHKVQVCLLMIFSHFFASKVWRKKLKFKVCISVYTLEGVDYQECWIEILWIFLPSMVAKLISYGIL